MRANGNNKATQPEPVSGIEPGYLARVAESFQDFYDTGRDRWTGSETNEQVTEFAVKAVHPAAGAGARRRVLDIGCGRGHQTVQFAELLDADVVGIDLLSVVDTPPPVRGSVRFDTGDFLSFTDDPFHLVVDNGCLHHQQPADWQRWVNHGADLLCPDGVFVVSLFLSPNGEVSLHPQANGRQNVWFTLEAVVELFANAGLRHTDTVIVDRHFRYQGHDLHYLLQSFGRD